MSPLGRRRKHEKIEAWRITAEAELARLTSLTGPELGAEVLTRGFPAGSDPDAPRTRIGLSNTLCPEAPPVVGGDDIDVVAEFGRLVSDALLALEGAGLLMSRQEGKSALRFYRVTESGRAALADSSVAARLGG